MSEKTYEEFLQTKESKEYALSEEEAEYYINRYMESVKTRKFEIRDIVFVKELQID